MFRWPDTLPRYPQKAGFLASPRFDKAVVRTPMGAGPDKVRRRTSARTEDLSCTWLLSAAQVEDILRFMEDDLAMGALGFYMNHPRRKSVELIRTNAGFELGNFAGWNAGDAVISTTEKHSGSYSSKLVAAGADTGGAYTNPIRVDEKGAYSWSAWNKITALPVGDYSNKITFYSDEDGTAYISLDDTWYTAVMDWTLLDKTVGPSGDIAYPAGTKSIRLQQHFWNASGNPDGTAYMDDVSFIGPEVALCRFLGKPDIRPAGGKWLVSAEVEVLP